MKKINRNFFKPFMFICVGLMAVMLMSATYKPPGAPGKPEMVDTGNDWCTIKFTPPTDDGGAPITAYLVDYRDIKGGRWVRGAETDKCKVTVRNLKEGIELEFRVSAVNEGGEGPHSVVSEVISIKE